jgi:hypothetical protein
MTKFARTGLPTSVTLPPGPVKTTSTQTSTHEGGAAWTRDAKSDLFLFAAVNMVGEDTFYEPKGARDKRFRDLVHKATADDPDWVARFVPYLRREMNMRSASVVMAVESALARLGRVPGVRVEVSSKVTVRQLVASALDRADEPAEAIAYWRSRTGKRSVPGGVQRGIADATARLFSERAALKYDGVNRAWRMIDVVAVVKPKPTGPWQADLFDFLADKRWSRPEVRTSERLKTVTAHTASKVANKELRRAELISSPSLIKSAGVTWEELSSLGPMDKAAWEAMIPSMGYMALLRNLRNFDEQKVSDKVASIVSAKLADPAEVARSRQFPYRFLSAYREAPSLRWAYPLEQALACSTAAIPTMPGKTLILVDTSASMQSPVSGNSKMSHVSVGALIGTALAYRGAEVDFIGYATGWFKFLITPGSSMLKDIELFCAQVGRVGHGTNTIEALKATYNGQDRVIIVTDGQAFASGFGGHYDVRGRLVRESVSTAVPENVPVFGINTTGYAPSSLDTSAANRFEIGGFSDKVFQLFGLLARGMGSDWPF